ncbi:hypothetical protein [Edwardsiella tarda]|uniref:hypothetical protein n=1 Tax=Edwardsiella tarda TaxID=636 RepID=UPI00083B6C56|nr:hypothetical protein [Edwardsiella tarda]
MSKIDVWSTRIANFSQLGVLTLAVFGYFYTVLPVYQKSLLDEEIAKKTLELESKDKKINEFNQILKDRALELKALSEQVDVAKKDADVAKTSLRTMQGKYSKQYSELRIHLFGQFISLAYDKCAKLKWEKKTLGKCLNEVIDSKEMSELNSSDINKLRKTVATELPIMINNYNTKKSEYDSHLMEIDNKTKQAENECKILKSRSDYQDAMKKISIDHDCDVKIINISSEKIQVMIKFIFTKERVMNDALNVMATRAVN